jgi:hypothetical protein
MTKKQAEYGFPEGYKVHDGGECPVDPETPVDCIVMTADGPGHSGVQRARMQVWPHSEHPDGHGRVLAYREAQEGHGPIDILKRY